MPMFKLLYCSKDFRKRTGSFWSYYPNKPNSGCSKQPDDQADNIYEREKIFYPIKDSESFDYKSKLIGNLGNNLPAVNNLVRAEKDIKFVAPLKNLSNFIFS